MLPLVLLPGMMCDARLYTPQISAFSSKTSVQIPFLGGHSTMQELASAVLAQAPQHFALAGLSMGGILAMEIVRQAPERIAKLALLDTNPLAELDAIKAIRAPQIEAVRQGKLAEVMKGQMIPKYLPSGKQSTEIEQLCLRMALDLGPEVFIRQSLALRDRPDQRETLRRFQNKTLILCGAQDQLCPIERHELLQSLMPHAQLHILDGTGHLPTLEQPARTNAHLLDWFSS
ncbi:alpha/beta fold hydrolase [Polycladidibacter hongkongensis]|uniref:alpha/beta fold hydrolase n=1 Tax=Polycladidibacter hongkongensis TaxID=1647556 RepID=UPI0008354216|nr:alpha/beta hydrolase [Pseudovibrio hongkongensis]